jgi:hypothetical protein
VSAPDEYTHEKDCGASSDCKECQFHRLASKWASNNSLRLLQDKSRSVRWWGCRLRGRRWGAGCASCNLLISLIKKGHLALDGKHQQFMYSRVGRMAAFRIGHVELKRFRRHQDTTWHKLSELVVSGGLGALPSLSRFPVKKLLLAGAPSVEDFKRVWEAFRGGGGHGGVSGVGCRLKVQRMVWCIAEAIRKDHRRFLRSACTAAIHVDKRNSVMLVRFTASDKQLNHRSGILGMITITGTVRGLAFPHRHAVQSLFTHMQRGFHMHALTH